jgi:hypothetical protein
LQVSYCKAYLVSQKDNLALERESGRERGREGGREGERGQVPQHRLWRYIATLINTCSPNSSWVCEYATDAVAVRWIDNGIFCAIPTNAYRRANVNYPELRA